MTQLSENNETKISVIIPAYNVEAYIEQAINSVLSQSYPHFKLLIVDDASTDNTVEKIKTFTDSRLTLITGNKFGSPAKARNTALKQVTTPYVAFLDADDAYLPSALQLLLNAIEANPECYAVQGVYNAMDEHGTLLKSKPMLSSDGTEILPEYRHSWEALLNWKAIVALPASLFRANVFEAVQYFDENIPLSSDYHFFAKLCAWQPNGLIQLPAYIYTYRTHNKSFCHSPTSYLRGIEAKKQIHSLLVNSSNFPAHLNDLIQATYNGLYRSWVKECLALQQKKSLWDVAKLALLDKKTTKFNLIKQLYPYLLRSFLPEILNESLVNLKMAFNQKKRSLA
jgi:glycosyltransferase involved in cell wall biosynthesis